MMTKPTIIERFTPGWVNSIPRKLARGIWYAIEEAIDGKEHTHATENARRERQITAGTLGPTSRGNTRIAEGSDDRASVRRDERETARAATREERRTHNEAIREAVVAATEAGNPGRHPEARLGDVGDTSGRCVRGGGSSGHADDGPAADDETDVGGGVCPIGTQAADSGPTDDDTKRVHSDRE